MDICKILDGPKLTLRVEGRLDSLTAPELEIVFKTQLDAITTLVVDFEKLDYLSSAGLRALLMAQKRMNKQGSMVVRNANELVRDVFSMTGFYRVLTVE